MKKKIGFLGLTFFLTLGMTSCGATNHSYDEYRAEMSFKSDSFKIVQLTDLHCGIQTDMEVLKSYVKKSITDANNPDLLVFTGDTFMESNRISVSTLLDYIDSFNIPFAYTYGNHDLQGNYDYYYISSYIKGLNNSVYIDYDNDNIYGLTNYYINIKKNGTVVYRVYIIDSNSYYFNGVKYSYDIIHEDQIAHIEDITKHEGIVPSLAFFHIPLYEFKDAYKEYKAGNVQGRGENNEKCSVGYKRTNAFERMKKCGVQAMFIGHDHINYTDILYKDVILSYGIKSSPEIYNYKDIVGYKMITLNGFNKITFDNIQSVMYGEF